MACHPLQLAWRSGRDIQTSVLHGQSNMLRPVQRHLKLYNTIPGVEVPNGILIVAIWAALHLITKDIEVLVDGQGVVGITCGNEIGHGTRWNTQSAEDCQYLINDGIIQEKLDTLS